MTARLKALRLTTALACAMPIFFLSAHAQTALTPLQTPLSDIDCNGNAGSSFASCTVAGTRTVTRVSDELTTLGNGNQVMSTKYQVDFNGSLAVDGIVSGPFAGVNPGDLFSSAAVDVTTQYMGERFRPTGSPEPITDPNSINFFNRYSAYQTTVHAIGVDMQDASAYDADTGQEYNFNLKSIDPTAIIDGNRTALAGSYRSTSDESAIVFGKLSGSASLVSRLSRSDAPLPDSYVISPFALQYEVTAQETTRLDETGLATPKVSVTEGIEMNGSNIRNLADGVASGDAVNKGQLDAEATIRSTADAALASSISNESAARQAADVSLSGQIIDEAQQRAQNDLQIRQRIDNEASAREALASALTTESNARMTADLQLSSRIDALGDRLDQIDGRLDRLEDRVSSGTAVAVAMGGATFLPDMKFNLTANVATYGGAHAGAMQLGALVTPHVALNAGVATGLNRGGKTAARAGFTIGW